MRSTAERCGQFRVSAFYRGVGEIPGASGERTRDEQNCGSDDEVSFLASLPMTLHNSSSGLTVLLSWEIRMAAPAR
jgi:hypothetical protein